MTLEHLFARAGSDRVDELRAIKLCWPDLEAIYRFVRHQPRIEEELVTFRSERVAALLPAEVAVCGEKNLKGAKALLAVNNLPDNDMAGWSLLLVEHHRTQKVVRRVLSA